MSTYPRGAFLRIQLKQQLVKTLGIFVAVSWSQLIGAALSLAFERDAQVGRIAVTAGVCACSYTLAAAFLYAVRFRSNAPLIFVASVGGAVSISFRDLIEECVSGLDLAELTVLNGVDLGHGIGAAEADLPTAAVVLLSGTALIIFASRVRRAHRARQSSTSHGAGAQAAPAPKHSVGELLLEIECDAFGFCAAWVICDALYRILLGFVDEAARPYAAALFLAVALHAAERSVLGYGRWLHRRPAPSPDLRLLARLLAQAWAFLLGLSFAYLLSEIHVNDDSPHGRFATAVLASVLALAGGVSCARQLRASALSEFDSLTALVRSLPHVHWPPTLREWRHRGGGGKGDGDGEPPAAGGPRGAADRLRAECLPASWRDAPAEPVSLDEGGEGWVSTAEPGFRKLLARLRAQPTGAFVVYLSAPAGAGADGGPGDERAAVWGGESAIVLIRTEGGGGTTESEGEQAAEAGQAGGELLLVPIVQLPARDGGGRWTTRAAQSRAVRAELTGLALAVGVGYAWEAAFDHSLRLLGAVLPAEVGGGAGAEHPVAEGERGALLLRAVVAVVGAALFAQLCAVTGWHSVALTAPEALLRHGGAEGPPSPSAKHSGKAAAFAAGASGQFGSGKWWTHGGSATWAGEGAGLRYGQLQEGESGEAGVELGKARRNAREGEGAEERDGDTSGGLKSPSAGAGSGRYGGFAAYLSRSKPRR